MKDSDDSELDQANYSPIPGRIGIHLVWSDEEYGNLFGANIPLLAPVALAPWNEDMLL
jgi:hypothetical protein